jgi:hypothetical protein
MTSPATTQEQKVKDKQAGFFAGNSILLQEKSLMVLIAILV